MSFPKQWAQLWIMLPNTTTLPNAASLHWFAWSGTGTPANTPALQAAVNSWLANSVFSMLTFDSILLSEPLPWFLYVNPALGSTISIPGDTSINCPTVPCFPSFSNISIRRFTATPGPRGTGKFGICSIPRSWVTGDRLKGSAQTNLQNAANNMLTGFSADGFDFVPSLVSYTRATIEQITSYQVQPRLGVIKRRGRVNWLSSFGTGPKAPPP
jgi:hypothetical protein